MTTQKAVIPLHRYQSPNGNGLCTYETGGMVCGNAAAYIVHVTSQDFRPITDATLAPLVPGQGMPKDPVGAYLEEKADMAHETYHGASFPVDDPPTTAQIVAMFNDAALRLVASKSEGYGRAWEEQGWQGNLGRILSKASRLRHMLWRSEPVLAVGTEHVRETLLDLANLCAFMAHNLDEGNRWGKP